MKALLRRLTWWVRRRRKEEELAEELRFHLEEEADARKADGLTEDEARWAARRDLGNVTSLQEETRTLWRWTPLEQLAQDVRFGFRTMIRNRMFTALAVLSLALGIGANTAIYSFMDGILLRPLPVTDPGSLAEVRWWSKPFSFGNPRQGSDFVLRSISGGFIRGASGNSGGIFPFPAFDLLHEASTAVFSSLFVHRSAGNVTVLVNGDAQIAAGYYVSGEFFRGLALPAAAGRLLDPTDDRAGAPAVAVISFEYALRRFGIAEHAAGQNVLVNNLPFTVVGVTREGFFGVDPAAAPDVYLPLRTNLLLERDAAPGYLNANYYWLQMMGRLRPGVSHEQAQAALAAPFARWVATTASNDAERANLPELRIESGADGLDTLRRRYTKPLYMLLAVVGLILAIACANTANLLLARAAARKREMAIRLGIGAGRWRLIRQLLTESVLLSSLAGALGVLIAVWGMRVLTQLLANGEERFTLHAELNWNVLLVTVGLTLLCGVLFGLAPAVQATRPELMPALKELTAGAPRRRVGGTPRRLRLTNTLVVTQIAISLLLLVGAGLFVRTLSNLQSVQLGYVREGVLLFDVNGANAGYVDARLADFYAALRRRLGELPGVNEATLSHASLIRAGRSLPITANGQPTIRAGTRVLMTGPRFFSAMQVPILHGREFDERDRQGSLPVAVVSATFASTFFGQENVVGQQLTLSVRGQPLDLEIIGVASTARYGSLKTDAPPVVYFSYHQVNFPPLDRMTFALRTSGDPMAFAATVRQIVRDANSGVPVTNVRTQATEIDRTINQEIVFARLCAAFAILALAIACIGLYATMAYTVARRTSEIGMRIALGARQGTVIWMVLRDVCWMAAIGLALGVPIAFGASRLVESFLFNTKPNDPQTLAAAVAVLITAVLAARYGPARRAARVNPIVALRHD